MEKLTEQFNYTVHGILTMENISPSEKLVMIQIATAKTIGVSRVNVTNSAKSLGYTRDGWRKVAKRLIQKGMVVNPKRGYYGLTNTNIY
tara:strand:- start:246 stop:512 length:267 start_codon:yes stop_codon:yes gene_type:complete